MNQKIVVTIAIGLVLFWVAAILINYGYTATHQADEVVHRYHRAFDDAARYYNSHKINQSGILSIDGFRFDISQYGVSGTMYGPCEDPIFKFKYFPSGMVCDSPLPLAIILASIGSTIAFAAAPFAYRWSIEERKAQEEDNLILDIQVNEGSG